MNWKEFLKPDWKNVGIFAVILIVLYLLSPFTYQPSILFWLNPSFQLAVEIVYGFQSCVPHDIKPICSGFDFSGVGIMIISFLFWYVIAFSLAYLIRRKKK